MADERNPLSPPPLPPLVNDSMGTVAVLLTAANIQCWRNLELAEKLNFFSRDRLVEGSLMAMKINCNPLFSVCRKGLAKACCFVTTIDTFTMCMAQLMSSNCSQRLSTSNSALP
ncbi:hypothetical protein EJ110_NYTH48732 [Nymphaea thermarum]|nr:hypothetical protein EJ110_NYTH48732 [Nymphaea thermarum]